jgi:uncharacterized protein (TIGR02284 family)
MKLTAAETLNDLILINNDRVKGYERALKDTKDKDADLRDIFRQMMEQSKRFNESLIAMVRLSGSLPETESSFSGKLHRAWIDIKTSFAGNNRKSLLNECERGEDASMEAYNEALHEDNGLTEVQQQVIAEQAAEQKASHDAIRELRNQAMKNG